MKIEKRAIDQGHEWLSDEAISVSGVPEKLKGLFKPIIKVQKREIKKGR